MDALIASMRALGEAVNRPPHMVLAWVFGVSSDTSEDPRLEGGPSLCHRSGAKAKPYRPLAAHSRGVLPSPLALLSDADPNIRRLFPTGMDSTGVARFAFLRNNKRIQR
jgi:hypothetical protein